MDKVVERGGIDEGPLFASVGGLVQLKAKPVPGDASFPSGEPTWNLDSYPTGGGGVSFSSDGDEAGLSDFPVAGDYTVSAECGTSDSITIRVIEVADVTSDINEAYVGQDVNFVVATNPPNYGHLVNWTGGENPSDANETALFMTNWSTPGIKTAVAKLGAISSKQKSVHVFPLPTLDFIDAAHYVDRLTINPNYCWACIAHLDPSDALIGKNDLSWDIQYPDDSSVGFVAGPNYDAGHVTGATIPRKYVVQATYIPDGSTASATTWVYEMELDIDGFNDVDDSEENRGAYIALNGFATVSLDYRPSDIDGGSALFSRSGTNLRVWDGSTMILGPGTDNPQVWSLDSGYLPKQLDVQGYSTGSGYLYLGFSGTDVYDDDSDTVKFTVVQVELDISGVDEEDEEDPGGFLALNDMVHIYSSPPLPSLDEGTVKLEVESGSDKIKIWDATQTSVVTNLEWDLSVPAEKAAFLSFRFNGFYVEGIGISNSPRDVELKLSYTDPYNNPIDDDIVKLTVVGVEKIQYKIGSDAYQDAPVPPSTLAVAKGADVAFKAIKDPSSALSWPTNKPVWSGSSGASGTGEEKAVSFDTASSSPTDYKVVTAECGNTKSVNVVVVDLSELVINSNRTSSPSENSYPINAGEHIEIGGTFKFDLMLNTGTVTWPQPVKLGAEVWDLDYINEVIASGTGPTISHTFGTGSHDDGTCETRFYFDNNTSGDSTTGWNDPHVDSDSYEAKEFNDHVLTFAKSSAVTGSVGGGGACSGATDLILSKDTADDYRAVARLLAAGLSTIPAGTHDPMKMQRVPGVGLLDTWNHWSYFINYDSAEVVIVSDVIPCDANGNQVYPDTAGFSQTGTKYAICLEQGDVNGSTLAHEVGHSCGLGHNNANVDNVMYESTAGSETLLTQSEAAAFE
jgi:hypothetical protein